ncbi:MAG: hypothetical protein Q9174_003724 [Haloplaca sp. 1 TL-2023]
MPEGLRGLVERKLGLVGPRLQTLWADLSLLSNPTESSPRRSRFPITSHRDDSSEGTLLPLFHAPPAKDNVPAPEGSATEKASLEPMTTPSSRVADVLPFWGASVTVATQIEPCESQDGALDIPQSGRCEEETEDAKIQTEGSEPRTSSEILPNPEEAPKILEGPSQVVVARYDNEDHFAILITQEMLERLGRAMDLERELDGLKMKIQDSERELGFKEYSLRDLKEFLEEAESDKESEEHRQAIEKHQNVYETEKARYEALISEELAAKGNSDYVYGMARDVFQEPLIKEGLLKEHMEPTEEEDTGKAESTHLGSDDSDHLTTSAAGMDELERMHIQEEIDRKFADFVQAERDFDNRHEYESEQRAKYRQMVLDQTCSLTQTEFDHRLLEATRLAAQDLEDAENAYDDVLARRETLVNEEEDGYYLSSEDEEIKEGSEEGLRQWIGSWLEDIPEVTTIATVYVLNDGAADEFEQESQADLSEWDSGSVHMSDSLSCHDGTRNRKRIDRWREISGRMCR